MTLSGLLIIVAVFWALAYIRAGSVTWIITPLVLLLALGLSELICGYPLFFLFAIYLFCIALYAKPSIRKKYISEPLLNKFRKVMPSM